MRTITRGAALAALAVGLGAAAQPAAPPASGPVPAGPAPNTTGPIDQPMIASIGTGVYFINEFGADSIYLVIGERRALVIDTGSGFIDLKAVVEGLTKLPYDVAVTHGHPDHGGGAAQFDAVYINPADIQAVRNLTHQGRVNYGRLMRGMAIGYPNVWAYDDTDVRQWDRTPEFRPMPDGHVFDLGGRKVTAYHLPNHTPGSTVLIDDKSRILFSGDAINFNVGANGAVSTALRGFLKMRELRRDYDRTFWGHVAYAGRMNVVPQNPQVLDDLIEAYRSILRGNPTLQVQPNALRPGTTQTVAVHGVARVTFNPERLWEPGEAQVVP